MEAQTVITFQPDARETQQFERLAQASLPGLRAAALRIANNRDDAEDLVQETLVRAYTRFYQFQSHTNFGAWLLTILRHIAINEWRRRQRQPEVEIETDDQTAWFDSVSDSRAPQPAEEAFAYVLDEDVERALAQLPATFCRAVWLCDVEGLDYEEISRTLHCPLGTVRSRIHRGRQILRRKLQGYAQEYYRR